MFSPSESEIGGTGFNGNEYSFDPYFMLDSNDNSATNPYIPIEQELMGRNWGASEFDSSLPAKQPYPYRDIYSMKDPMRLNDYYLDNSSGVKEYLFTNNPTFHATEPFRKFPKYRKYPQRSWMDSDGPSSNFMIFIVLMFIVLVIVALVQGAKIDKLQHLIMKDDNTLKK